MNKPLLFLLFAVMWFTGASAQTMTVTTFDNTTHTAAETINETFSFPADNSMYDRIEMNIALTCPAGGCDPWDRFATLKLKKYGEKFEIGRYVTPYGNNWCTWTIDVTDYRQYLVGDVELESFIETYSNGWDLTVDFVFHTGTPQYEYVDVKNLWVDYFMIYGDTTFWSINLDERNVNIPSNAEEVLLRVVNTGHGQGNSGNAAEFLPRDHDIKVNGSNAFTQSLWNNDCNVNPCSPQGGTWQFARAGWCPGEDVHPDDYNLTNLVTPGQLATIDYVLEPYYNFCSPWNQDCNSGSTCNDCNYNGNGHTQPNYKISVQLIVKSTTPVNITGVEEEVHVNRIKVYPSPSNGQLEMYTEFDHTQDLDITVVDLSGRIVHQTNKRGVQQGVSALDLTHLPNGIYTLSIDSPEAHARQKIVIAH